MLSGERVVAHHLVQRVQPLARRKKLRTHVALAFVGQDCIRLGYAETVLPL
jgi:hypothetical protein